MASKVVRLREHIRDVVLKIRHLIFTKYYGMDISPTAVISYGAKLDKAGPQYVHIGDYSYVASGAVILGHDYARAKGAHTYIGKQCFIGANAIIMAGVRIGNNCIVGAGAIVTKNAPPIV